MIKKVARHLHHKDEEASGSAVAASRSSWWHRPSHHPHKHASETTVTVTATPTPAAAAEKRSPIDDNDFDDASSIETTGSNESEVEIAPSWSGKKANYRRWF